MRPPSFADCKAVLSFWPPQAGSEKWSRTLCYSWSDSHSSACSVEQCTRSTGKSGTSSKIPGISTTFTYAASSRLECSTVPLRIGRSVDGERESLPQLLFNCGLSIICEQTSKVKHKDSTFTTHALGSLSVAVEFLFV